MSIRGSVIAALRAAADPARAPQQQAYMKSDMPYLGVGVPQCRRIAGSVFRAHPLPDADAWETTILELWRTAAHREERYAAIELLLFGRYSRWLEPARFPLVEELVVTGAWWDYVDAIAGRGVGTMLAAHPDATKPVLREWAKDDDIWKRRTAILAQLRAGRATDTGLLADAIRPSIGAAGVLPAQGHRLGAARVFEDRPGLGAGIRRNPRRTLRSEPARSPQVSGAGERGGRRIVAAASWLGGIGTALGHRDYRIYSIGASASFLGTWIYRTALGWLAWELTRSPAWLGIVVFCEVVPIIALVPLTGAATDRLGAYRIFRAGQIAASGVMAALAILTALDLIAIEILLALVVLNGVNMAFMQPSYFALVANLVPREDLSSAIAFQSSMVQTARFIGPAIAGVLLVWQGAALAFAVNAATYIGMVWALLALSYRDLGRQAGGGGSLLGDVAQGLRYTASHETIRALLLMTVAFSVLLRPVVELLPAFASDVFGRGADGLATLLSSAGAGAIVGSLVLARRGRTQGLTRLLGASGVLCGIAVAGFASTGAFWLGIVLMAVYGLLSNTNSICSQILIQNCVDPGDAGAGDEPRRPHLPLRAGGERGPLRRPRLAVRARASHRRRGLPRDGRRALDAGPDPERPPRRTRREPARGLTRARGGRSGGPPAQLRICSLMVARQLRATGFLRPRSVSNPQ